MVEEPNAYTGLALDERSVLLKIHGHVDRGGTRERESFAVSEDDHIDYLAGVEAAGTVPVQIAARLRRSHLLFLGYAVDDWSLRVFLRRVWGHDRLAYRSWAVQPSAEALARELWRERGVEAYDAALEGYSEQLARVTGGARSAGRGRMSDRIPDRPYKGLARFDDSELDERFFFGRERETELVAANLVASRLTVLYGPSGVGKSSLLRAGRRAPAARARTGRRRRGDGDGALPVVVDAWRDDPLAAIAAAAGARGARDAARSSPTCSRSAWPRWTASSTSCSTRWRSTSSITAVRAAGRCARRWPRSSADRRCACTCCSASATMRSPSWTRSRGGCRACSATSSGSTISTSIRRAPRSSSRSPSSRRSAGRSVEAEPALVAAVVDQVASGRIERRLAGRGIVDGAAKRGRVEAPYLQLVMERLWEVERARGSDVLRAATLAELGGVGPDRAAAPRACAGRARRARARARRAALPPARDALGHQDRARRRRPQPVCGRTARAARGRAPHASRPSVSSVRCPAGTAAAPATRSTTTSSPEPCSIGVRGTRRSARSSRSARRRGVGTGGSRSSSGSPSWRSR